MGQLHTPGPFLNRLIRGNVNARNSFQPCRILDVPIVWLRDC
jgi:hypothetical protein